MHRIPRGSIRIAVPDVSQQTGYSCGPSSLESIAKFYGVGSEDEREFIRGLRMDPRVGSHAHQIRRLAKSYGLRAREYKRMSPAQLRQELRWRHPVLLAIQAFGRARQGADVHVNGRFDYGTDWNHGHWVVAIGYDRDGFFFEDSLIQARRGWLPSEELVSRWHDTGPRGRHQSFYGLAVWRGGKRASSYATLAERIP
jgi:predicted double-glycine peptidase